MWAWLGAAFGAGGTVATVVASLVGRRKVEAEADDVVMTTVRRLVGMLDEQVQSLARRVTDLEERLAVEQSETRRLRRWVGMLIDQLRALGVEPVAEPSE